MSLTIDKNKKSVIFYVKKKTVVIGLLALCGLGLAGCDGKSLDTSPSTTSTSSEIKNLDGTYSYVDDDETIEVVIDGKDILYTDEYDTYDGTVNSEKKKFEFEPEDETSFEYDYKLIGDKLVLKSDDGDYTLSRTSSTSEKAETPSKEESSKSETLSSETSGVAQTLSGKVIVGEDIQPGKYDIKPDGSVDASMQIFENQEDVTNDNYDFEWLFPADEEDPEGDILKSYTLREGNILDIEGNMSFTKK